MSGGKVHPKSDESNVTEVVEKEECNIIRSEANQKAIGIMSECVDNTRIHSNEALHRSEPSIKKFPNDVSENEEDNEEVEKDEEEDDEEGFSWRIKLKNIQYLRLGCNTDALNILKPFEASNWEMLPPEVFFSVLSDSDCDTGKRHEANESNPKESVLDIRKMFCRRLVETVVTTNAWIITGGLNRGVDQLIGNEVKRRLANWKKISKVVLGITNLEYFAEKKNLLNNSHGSKGFASDRNQTGVSLNQHHTHFLLVDYDVTQKSSSECNLRQIVELALAKKAPYRSEKDGLDRPLIYILVGGRINALRAVERALNNQLPVIVAMVLVNVDS